MIRPPCRNKGIRQNGRTAIFPLLANRIYCTLYRSIYIEIIISITALNITININIRRINENSAAGNSVATCFTVARSYTNLMLSSRSSSRIIGVKIILPFVIFTCILSFNRSTDIYYTISKTLGNRTIAGSNIYRLAVNTCAVISSFTLNNDVIALAFNRNVTIHISKVTIDFNISSRHHFSQDSLVSLRIDSIGVYFAAAIITIDRNEATTRCITTCCIKGHIRRLIFINIFNFSKIAAVC